MKISVKKMKEHKDSDRQFTIITLSTRTQESYTKSKLLMLMFFLFYIYLGKPYFALSLNKQRLYLYKFITENV